MSTLNWLLHPQEKNSLFSKNRAQFSDGLTLTWHSPKSQIIRINSILSWTNVEVLYKLVALKVIYTLLFLLFRFVLNLLLYLHFYFACFAFVFYSEWPGFSGYEKTIRYFCVTCALSFCSTRMKWQSRKMEKENARESWI